MDIRLDPLTHDIDLTNGAARLVTGRDAIIQHLKIRLNMVKGECFMDPEVGLPLFDRILVEGENEADVLSIYRNAIETSPGIVSVEEINSTFDRASRKLTIWGKARDIDGVFDFGSIPLVSPEP